jgi:hypothetical protein
MGANGEEHDYRGTWAKTGTTIELQQTHEDDEEKTDTMTGHMDGSRLRLLHEELGLQMPYVLRRPDAATPGR